MLPSWMTSVAAAGAALLSSGLIGGVQASSYSTVRMPASPGYRGREHNCPTSCAITGPDPANWPVYQNLHQLDQCGETIFYHISLFDNVDDNTVKNHRIFACTSYGSFKDAGPAASTMRVQQTLNNATFTIGHWDENAPTGVDLRDLSRQMRRFLKSGYQATPGNTSTSYAETKSKTLPQILFAQTKGGTVGLYVGKAVQSLSSVNGALKSLESSLTATNETTGTVAMELCGTHYDADHIIGFIATSNTSFAPVQQVLQSWSKATCIDYNSTETFVSPVSFTTPLAIPASNSSSSASNSTSKIAARGFRGLESRSASLSPRADCTTVQVVFGDTCGTLATKCGISGADFTTYNSDENLCSSLQPGQHVCCSSGTLPSFAPKPNDDGSCYSYTVVANDNCAVLSAAYDLTNEKIESFNNNTWGWQGCGNVLLGAVICLSTGDPPMPAAVPNAVCGPQVVGTVPGPGGTFNLSGLNPCALNACCDIWGQCGVTEEFCTDTSLGPPGTAKNGTNGCISNCGTDVVSGPGPASPINLAYFEGFGMDRPCLYQDASQLSNSLTHIHFAFGTLDPDTYAVNVGTTASTYEFDSFRRLGSSFHRVLTIGGWTFSTDPSTYNIFRSGVTSANRVKMATAIANFITDNDLDGIDIDWEYPGAPDIPGIPAGNEDDGTNFLAFLVILKNMLPGKTVSIAAPSSYWYLKQFPIEEIGEVVDYIVFMTYDLHGQWDSGNGYAQEGCSTGNCLRSHVNITETMNSLAMITKAGVPSAKVVVGVTSYGRSFGMTDPSCYGPECTFGGGAAGSTAVPGPCTGTAGYLADAEIYDIMQGTDGSTNSKKVRRDSTALSSRVSQYYYDEDSDSQVLVYDDNQWVSFMTPDILASRTAKYADLGLGGTTNWAIDLEEYHDPPGSLANWDSFLLAIKLGINPTSQLAVDPTQLTGNWTKLTCTDPAVTNVLTMSSEERWDGMDCTDAWNDVISVWNNVDIHNGVYLSASISASINGPESSNCGSLAATSNCDRILLCKDVEGTTGSGPAAYEIWNSLVYVHEIYETFHDTIIQAAALSLNPSLDEFENVFAPVTPPDDTWLNILLAFVNLAGTVVVSGFFNSILKALPFFRAHGVQYDNYKDTAKALVSFGVSVTSEYVTGNEGDWTAGAQTHFNKYLGQVVDIWANTTEAQLGQIFSGQPDTLPVLAGLIDKGQMIEGADGSNSAAGTAPNVGVSDATTSVVEASIVLAFYAFAIPAVWRAAGTGAFILDTGADCSDLSVASEYVDTSMAKQAMGCVDNRLYFLAYPDGASSTTCPLEGSCTDNSFSLPHGVDQLDGKDWGGVTVSDIVTGSVRTYLQNGNKNGGAVADPSDLGTRNNLYDQDITTPGYIRLPVCSGQLAFSNWDRYSDRTLENWPCYVPPPANDCESSSFIDQTSDASPSVEDCMQIVNNIVGTDGRWEVQTAGKAQHQLVQYGNCKFGIQATNLHGNIYFHIAASDIVDIITDSVNQFGGSGKVGAKGYMDCGGNINSQDVMWGLY